MTETVRSCEFPALPVVLAVVSAGDDVLLIRREREPFAGQWGLPGGKMRYGEHLDDAVLRELREETGIEARFTDYYGVVSERVEEEGRLTAHYLLHVCRLEAFSRALVKSEEGEARWFAGCLPGTEPKLSSAKELLIPSDRLILERLVHAPTPRRFWRCVVSRSVQEYRVTEFQ